MTSAAVVMVSVFAIFATLSLVIFKQLGIGLAVAVLLDATLVRGVLLPATMKLLGDWNWYLPEWLEWLPHVGPGDGSGLPPEPSSAHPQAQAADGMTGVAARHPGERCVPVPGPRTAPLLPRLRRLRSAEHGW